MSTATSPVRFGILGAAKILNRLMPAFRKSGAVEAVAIASRDADKAQEAAAGFDIRTAHAGYDALIADPNVEAVYIPLPNDQHAEWTKKAADAGKHVLCEKPLTPLADDAAELVAHCRAKNVRLMDGFMWPHHPRSPKLRAAMADPRLGSVRRINSVFTFRLEPLDGSNIRLHRNMGGGSLLDVGCYPVYGVRYLFGAEPTHVTASATFQNDVDVSLTATLFFADGREAWIECGFTAAMRQWLEVVGTHGRLFVKDLWVPDADGAFTVEPEGGETERVATPGHDQIVCMLDDFAAAVREGREAVPSPDEAVKTLRVLNAIDRAARAGGRVAV